MWYVYMLQSGKTGHLYTGTTVDLARRLAEHNVGKKGAKRTRAGRPWRLVYHETAPSQSAALKREIAIKALRRKAKLDLIQNS